MVYSLLQLAIPEMQNSKAAHDESIEEAERLADTVGIINDGKLIIIENAPPYALAARLLIYILFQN